jgi:hypothetical protein
LIRTLSADTIQDESGPIYSLPLNIAMEPVRRMVFTNHRALSKAILQYNINIAHSARPEALGSQITIPVAVKHPDAARSNLIYSSAVSR